MTTRDRRQVKRVKEAKGSFVVVGGPDGVGKTTLASALVSRWKGSTSYFHFCPQLVGPLLTSPPRSPAPPPPKAPRHGSVVLGWLRLGRNLARFWVAYLVRIRPAVRRGSLVIGDRWAYGYVTQPYGLRFYGPARLARVALRWFPSPDYLLNLYAPPRLIWERKQELSLGEIANELERWSSLSNLPRFDIDATRLPQEIVDELIERLTARGSE